MSDFYERYQQGFHQEVYDELLAMGERVFDEEVYQDALRVMRAIMQRVRVNCEQLIARLTTMGYLFGEGLEDEPSAEEKRMTPVFQLPTEETPARVAFLEHLVGGKLLLSLKCWYEEVGTINLVGLFPPLHAYTFTSSDGCRLDPLSIYSVDVAIAMVTSYRKMNVRNRYPDLILAPDSAYKYGYGGDAPYTVHLPYKAFDAPLSKAEYHNITFVNYLRLCFRWGGFPGLSLAKEKLLTTDELAFLTEGLLPF